MSEVQIRLFVFIGVLVLMSTLETAFPARNRLQGRGRRWFTNFSLVVIDTLVLRLLFPVVAVGAAIWAERQGWGLMNFVSIPDWLAILLAVIVLDLMIYWQHVAFHRVPLLWRFHKIHHADRDLDASSGLRFHPVEIVISMIYKIALVICLGVPVMAVIIFEILLNACAIFNHANIRLPHWLEKHLRLILVTPALHRIHHSVLEPETNSNFGFSVIWWDRVFKSYTDQPKNELILGLNEYQTNDPSGLWWSLAAPFLRR